MSTISLPSVSSAFFSPALNLVVDCLHHRECPELPDAAWIHFGIDRVRQDISSGRGYLQQYGYRSGDCPRRANYFESLKSQRRLRLVTEVNTRLIHALSPSLEDPLARDEELADFDLYAGDGHWHGAAAHDAPIDGKKRAVGHAYALDLRRHLLCHLELAQGKHEHDIHLLKRLEGQQLRHHAPKGRKVLYVWDKAGIDFPAWHRWKNSHGVYFISLEKENMKLKVQGLPEWDRQDPVNAGIECVEWVAGGAGVMLRRIRYLEPIAGEVLSFLTSEMKVRPGLIAFLYKLRWDVEKVFDELKNRFSEQQAWASSPTAKNIQAQFICLAHNLVLWVDAKLKQEGIENRAELDRKEKQFKVEILAAAKAGRKIPAPVLAIRRLTQRSVKLLRWLKSSLLDRIAWDAATPRLRVLYATL